MIHLHELSRSKIDSFFDTDGAQEVLKYASQKMNDALTQIQDEAAEKFADYLRDEFRLMFDDIIRAEVIRVVQSMLLGDKEALEEFNLAPADWGLKGDWKRIRQTIVEQNADIIRNTHIQALEEELERAREMLKEYRSYR